MKATIMDDDFKTFLYLKYGSLPTIDVESWHCLKTYPREVWYRWLARIVVDSHNNGLYHKDPHFVSSASDFINKTLSFDSFKGIYDRRDFHYDDYIRSTWHRNYQLIIEELGEYETSHTLDYQD